MTGNTLTSKSIPSGIWKMSVSWSRSGALKVWYKQSIVISIDSLYSIDFKSWNRHQSIDYRRISPPFFPLTPHRAEHADFPCDLQAHVDSTDGALWLRRVAPGQAGHFPVRRYPQADQTHADIALLLHNYDTLPQRERPWLVDRYEDRWSYRQPDHRQHLFAP